MSGVSVRQDRISFPTFLPEKPLRQPMFLERRVYQGSSGRVYPLPFHDRVSQTPQPVEWDAIHLENEYLYVLILPEIGGRIHILRDKTNGYDAVYHQPVIKPALVGLAGPWISGGIEFNWPQHHRPSTFMPASAEIEREADGSVTVWLSEHDPMQRMKGMHGVCLRPGKAFLELKARVYNRTPISQTFLWWANVATQVHEGYQSCFPEDATHVADHAKRATSQFPLCETHYYGVDYAARGREGVPDNEKPRQFMASGKNGIPTYSANDLSWYANIPVPTSYMAMGSNEDFFGGYDHIAQAGLVHLANHHISPGKKQWTWGNHEFGYAWDRNLAEPDVTGTYPPYIELMAGVYTDNQPDFSFLQPGETKQWNQYWYPVQQTGGIRYATLDAALGLVEEGGNVRIGISVTADFTGAKIRLEPRAGKARTAVVDLRPGKPYVTTAKGSIASVTVIDSAGKTLLKYSPRKRTAQEPPPPATEPGDPESIASADELYITGLHLDQYRHATRCPTLYWREALRRDPGDSRCNNALGFWHLRRGEFPTAEKHFRAAIARATLRNPNPRDGEPLYNLGLCLRYLGREDEAYKSFYKATWNREWAGPAYHALAEIDVARLDWPTAIDHLHRTLRMDADNLKARNLLAIAFLNTGKKEEADAILKGTLRLDPLDAWALHLQNPAQYFPGQIALDLAFDLSRCGLFTDAIEVLENALSELGTAPMLHYTAAWLHDRMKAPQKAKKERQKARKASADYCFPSRIEEAVVLEAALLAEANDARAHFYLGNLLYDKRRHREAIEHWKTATRHEPKNAIAWRNLGIGLYNILQRPKAARDAYEEAFRNAPEDGRLLYERDQLWKRLGVAPIKRLQELERHLSLVQHRDDLTIELCALYNQTNAPEKAEALLSSRVFQPWEGGEGMAMGQHVRSHLLLGCKALDLDDGGTATEYFERALSSPLNLGEAKHLLSNQSDIYYFLGNAASTSGRTSKARQHWKRAASFKGDFQEMSVRNYSELTFYTALALNALGRKAAADKLLRDLLTYAEKLESAPAKVDYFATSLPTMLLFNDDLQLRQALTARFMKAQALVGLGKPATAQTLLREILKQDPNHYQASDLLHQLCTKN